MVVGCKGFPGGARLHLRPRPGGRRRDSCSTWATDLRASLTRPRRSRTRASRRRPVGVFVSPRGGDRSRERRLALDDLGGGGPRGRRRRQATPALIRPRRPALGRRPDSRRPPNGSPDASPTTRSLLVGTLSHRRASNPRGPHASVAVPRMLTQRLAEVLQGWRRLGPGRDLGQGPPRRSPGRRLGADEGGEAAPPSAATGSRSDVEELLADDDGAGAGVPGHARGGRRALA